MVKPNEQQQMCIDNVNGRFLVLAGPGTGKTFTIVNRIKSMVLDKKINPEKILCLTFTDTAAKEMKDRIEKELKVVETPISVYTYHSFCNDIIKDYPEIFELPENYRLISDAVSRSFIKEAIEEINPVGFRTDKGDPYFYISDIIKRINDIKQNRLKKEDYFKNLETNPDWMPLLEKYKEDLRKKVEKGDTRTVTVEKNIVKTEKDIKQAQELWEFYELYTQKMEKYHYIDFNDMISMVLDKFDNDPGFLETVANKYEYLLVDEYQDTNQPQNSIVFSLAKGLKSQNVFVVGDDDQIIFSFQGARLDTMQNFLREFPDTEVICLKENMRSSQTVLDVSRQLIIQDNQRLEGDGNFRTKYNIDKKLTAKNKDMIALDKPVRLCKYADALQEQNEIINEIEALINSDECPKDDEGKKDLSQIAILIGSNRMLQEWAELLKNKKIEYELKDGRDIFSIKSVIVMFYYMQLLVNPEMNADKVFRILLNHPFDINPKDYATLYNKKSKNKVFLDSMRELTREECLDYGLIENFLKVYDELREYVSNENLRTVILTIGAKTGIFDYYLNSEVNRTENIAGLKKLVDEAINIADIDRTAGLADFVEYLETSMIDDIPIVTDKAPVKRNAVQLSTYHSAKGKEYEYVYMPYLFSTQWESNRKSNKPKIPLAKSKTEDELKQDKYSNCLKVLYVGMTRAKHCLRLSYFTPGKGQSLCKFISEIQSMFEKVDMPEYDMQTYWNEAHKTLIKKDYDYKADFADFIDSKLENMKFSASAVNTYLKCPRQYLYSHLLGFETGTGSPDAMSFGTAVHATCEHAVKYAKEHDEYPTKDEFIEVFKKNLRELPFSSYQQRAIKEEFGEKVLDKYYPYFCRTKISHLKEGEVEYKFEFELEGVKFKGFIDRIDKNDDGTYAIYDYKTGSAKSLKEICVGGGHEDYYNQIGLYKYFYEKVTGNKVSVTGFIFPQEFDKNLQLEFTQQELEDIKNKFVNAIKDIKSHNFEPVEDRNKMKEPCKYCAYREFCNLEVI